MLLYSSLDFIRNQLNSYFKNSVRWNENKAVVTSLNGKENGSSSNTDSLQLTLINIRQESTLKNQSIYRKSGSEYTKSSRPQSFYMDFLASANCTNYEESLKLISDTIQYFQSNQYFDHSNSPGLIPEISKLSLSTLDGDLSETVHFWSAHGANYLPSIAYRARIVVFDGTEIKETLPSVSSSKIRKD